MNIRDALLLIRGHAERQLAPGRWLHFISYLPVPARRLPMGCAGCTVPRRCPSQLTGCCCLAQVQAQIAECDIALGGGSRDALVLSDDALSKLAANFNELDKVVISLCERLGCSAGFRL